MTHDSSNSPTDNPPTGSGLPPLPGADREAPSSELPPLPPLPSPDRKESADNLPPLPPLPQGSLPPLPADGPSAGAETEPENIIHVQPSDLSAGPQEMEAFPPASEALQLTAEQDFILTLSPAELHTLCEGASFIPAAVAMADGDVDDQERAAFEISDTKFEELFVSGNEAVDAQFNDRFAEAISQADNQNVFGEKIANAKSDEEANRWITFFMADLSRVLERAPDPVRQKIVDHVRESCLAVGEASGDGTGSNICGNEAAAITELLALIGVNLDEETHNRIFASAEQPLAPETAETGLQTQEAHLEAVKDELLAGKEVELAELEAVKDELLAGKEAELEALKDKLSAESEAFRYLSGLSEQQRPDLWFGLLATPSLVSYADGEQDSQEVMAESEAAEKLMEGMLDWIIPSNLIEECSEEFLGILLIDLQLKPCLEAIGKGVLRHDSLVIEGTALDRNQKIVDLLEEYKPLLNQAPDSLQAELKKWLLESSVKVAEASGSDLEGDDKLGIEERQFLVQLFTELELEYQGTPLEQRLNLHPEGQTFDGYYQSLNQQDRVRLLALPQVLVEIVAAADGKIDAAEAKAIAPILKEETALIDEGFAALRQSEADEICAFGSALSKEYRALRGKNKKQLEWLFGLLDGYWKMIAVMPDPLQDNIKSSIARMVVKIAAVSGEESGVGGNIGMDEALTINLIFEALGIDSDELETELEESQ